jgi:hypothetical protein
MRQINGRGERIRTSDPLVPNQVRYQTAPLPDTRVEASFCLFRWILSNIKPSKPDVFYHSIAKNFELILCQVNVEAHNLPERMFTLEP